MRLAVDRVMGEGSLYSPFHAAVALKQAEGDSVEASFLLRAYRSTLPRVGYSVVADPREMTVVRRISAAFKDVPGGQVLGPTRDYSLRLLDLKLAEESEDQVKEFLKRYTPQLRESVERPSFPKVVDMLRADGLLENPPPQGEDEEIPDITRQPLSFPASRPVRLQCMARAETGGLMTLAYSSMRGYGNVHPTLGELRVGYVPLGVSHGTRQNSMVIIGQVMVTEAEIIARINESEEDASPQFTLGYGMCFGHNEIKAISMAVLDRTMRNTRRQWPAEDEEFVLYHTDGIEASGFTAHWKLPHYVTFQSALDRLRRIQEGGSQKIGEKADDGYGNT
jgi:alpha-D-ribose 1-methylphosphonate 5-triphosphate synthase subunit PhnI